MRWRKGGSGGHSEEESERARRGRGYCELRFVYTSGARGGLESDRVIRAEGGSARVVQAMQRLINTTEHPLPPARYRVPRLTSPLTSSSSRYWTFVPPLEPASAAIVFQSAATPTPSRQMRVKRVVSRSEHQLKGILFRICTPVANARGVTMGGKGGSGERVEERWLSKSNDNRK